MIEEHYVPGRKGKIGYQYRVNTGLSPAYMDGETFDARVSEMTRWCHENTSESGVAASANHDLWGHRLMRFKPANPPDTTPARRIYRSTHYMFFLFNNPALATLFMLRFKPVQS